MDPKKLAIGLMVKKGKMPEPDEASDADEMDGTASPDADEMDGTEAPDADLVDACHDLIDAIKDGNEEAVAAAFKDCFTCCESVPHDEAGPPEEE